MRHGKKYNHLGRKEGHRKALLRNLTIALIEHKRIKTTLAKARALRVYVEPLITKAKTGSLHNRRVVFSYIQNKEAIKELFDGIAEKTKDRPGGYIRIIKLPARKSDGAEMALIELVDYNEDYAASIAESNEGSKKRRRRRAGSNTVKAKQGVEEQTEDTDIAEIDEEDIDENSAEEEKK
ncbi:MAG: 50S ribosomal protein L17 [Saprospiraceae bacterium]|nr:50S ribosomal protein L17 [Saprospiraceae bacterium]